MLSGGIESVGIILHTTIICVSFCDYSREPLIPIDQRIPPRTHIEFIIEGCRDNYVRQRDVPPGKGCIRFFFNGT